MGDAADDALAAEEAAFDFIEDSKGYCLTCSETIDDRRFGICSNCRARDLRHGLKNLGRSGAVSEIFFDDEGPDEGDAIAAGLVVGV